MFSIGPVNLELEEHIVDRRYPYANDVHHILESMTTSHCRLRNGNSTARIILTVGDLHTGNARKRISTGEKLKLLKNLQTRVTKCTT